MNIRAVDNIGMFLDDNGCPKGAFDFIKEALDKIKSELADRVVEAKPPEANKKLSYVITNSFDTPLPYYGNGGFLSYHYEVTKDKDEVFFDIKKGRLIISVSKRTAPLSDYLTHYLIFSGSLDKFEKEFNG